VTGGPDGAGDELTVDALLGGDAWVVDGAQDAMARPQARAAAVTATLCRAAIGLRAVMTPLCHR